MITRDILALRAALSVALVALVALVASCSRAAPAPASRGADAAPSTATPHARYGAVMAEVGRRFELAGRAAAAGRFELAEFEAGELGELFDEDLPGAELPKEGPTAALPAQADAFAKTAPADLAKAAKAKDARAFEAAFARAAVLCNACHQSAEKAFLQVPTVPGQAVPVIEPVTPPTATGGAPPASGSAAPPKPAPKSLPHDAPSTPPVHL